MSGMDELVRWFGEQLDEDERIARAADADLANLIGCVEIEHPATDADEAHALQHRPARVLREIDAKRQVLELHSPSEFGPWVGADDDDEPACQVCGDLTVRFPCRTLRLLALPYADRAGYLESWRP